MRWITLLATAAALHQRRQTTGAVAPRAVADHRRGAGRRGDARARPPTQPCDALALCMASWAASQKQQGDLLPKLAAKLPRPSEARLAALAEVLFDTARARSMA